ncbi:SIP domain-containing protein, partial [Streptomyces sp. SID3343]|uniref:SIP domain-containing protein n=1 Tax=Streptomyces sp. SID3343 TaxID=2690260 RepID=UPI00137153A3
TVEHQDPRELRLPEDEFDVVHSSWLLHRLADPEVALRAMARAVLPGGQVVLQWSFGRPAADGLAMRDALDGVYAHARWKERLAGAPSAIHRHSVERVRDVLVDEGLEIVVEQRDVAVSAGPDPEALRRFARATAFSEPADVLGDDADAFVDEVLSALFESGHADLHNARLIARRRGDEDDVSDADDGDQAPLLVRPFPQAVGLLEVVEADSLSPLMRRLTLHGEGLADMIVEQPGEIVTLIWPARGTEEIFLPEPGRWRFAGGREQPARNYTVRAFDAEARSLTVDFFLHGDHGDRGFRGEDGDEGEATEATEAAAAGDHGAAGRWAGAARPGDRVGFAGSRVHWVTDPAAEWTLLVGDETALPAIAATVAELPTDHPTFVVLEVRDEAEHAALDVDHAHARVHWVHRGDAEPGRGRGLEDAVRALTLPDGPGQVWAAGESLVIRSLRAHLLKERELPKATVSALGYWSHPRTSRASRTT